VKKLSTRFEVLQGLTLSAIDGCLVGSESIVFRGSDGEAFELQHNQDCCEHVRVEDVVGDIQDVIGTPILLAELVTSEGDAEGHVGRYYADSHTWSFYKLRTIRGSVTIRWLGESNGYYGETVAFDQFVAS